MPTPRRLLRAARVINEGHFRRHLFHYRQVLKKQRDQLLENLNLFWPQSVEFYIPEGGLAMWVGMEKKVDTTAVFHQALRKNIVLTPGALFSVSDRFHNFVRLSFTHPMVGQRLQAMKKIGSLLRK